MKIPLFEMVKQEKCLLTTLKANNYIVNDKKQVCFLTFVGTPRKAGKHGCAKITYEYLVLKSNSRVKDIGKSRDFITKLSISKLKGNKIAEDENEITILPETNSFNEESSFHTFQLSEIVNINCFQELMTEQIYYFIWEGVLFYQNR